MCILLSTLAKSKVREGGVTRGTRGFWRTEEGERALSSFKFIGAPWVRGGIAVLRRRNHARSVEEKVAC